MKISNLFPLLCALLQLPSLLYASPMIDHEAAAVSFERNERRVVCKPVSHPRGRLFSIGGTVQYFTGTNAWWLGHLRTNTDVELALSQIAKTGMKVIRTWAFGNTNNAATEQNVYYQVLNSSGQYYNYAPANGIPRLDYAVASAETYGLQLVLSLLNNYDDLGGINSYTNAYGGTHTSWYTDAASQAAYRKWIKFVVSRYKSSCAVFAWELMNEPRCSGCNPLVIYEWAKSTSAYIKSLDSRHMVTLGDEGWLQPTDTLLPGNDGSYAYSGYEGVNFTKNLEIPTLDYGTFHIYPTQWGYNDTWANTWIKQHNAIGKAAGKPVVLEEYGLPYPADQRDPYIQQWQQTVLKETSLAYDSFWQFGTTFPSGDRPLDDYAIYYGTDEMQTLGNQHAVDMGAKRARASL